MIIPRQSAHLFRFSTLFLLSALLAGCVGGPTPRGGVEKSIWVSRYEYKSRSDIDHIMRRCAAAGFKSVMFQVRGNGTVLYASRFEVWSDQFGFKAPLFDPLSYAVRAAHANGLKLHAWVNVMTGWGGTGAPASKRQIFHTRPEWFLRTDRSELAKEGNYWFLNPCLREVRTYLTNICAEVVTGYPVDGLHLDYIRYPHGAVSERCPGDARSRDLFVRQTHRSLSDVAAFRAWKAGAVTQLVRQIREMVNGLPRRVVLTVAVNSNLDRIKQDVLQDWPRWARSGLVDAVFPMNYTERDALFDQRSRACVAAAGRTPVVMGVGVYAHQRANRSSRATVRQMNAALRSGAAGVCLFSYTSALKGEWTSAVTAWNRRR